MSLFLVFLILLSIAFILRIVPYILSPAGVGIDHWFWKSYIETYRKEKVFPPVLPRYVLDKHQWYPPFFPLLMAKLPASFFDKWSHLFSILMDLLRMLILLIAIAWQAEGNLYAIIIGGLVYATTPILVFYNVQLNPRVFGALFLDVILMLLLWYFVYQGPWWIWIVVIFLSALILLTHKMTTQLFWFLLMGWSLIYGDWRPLALIPVSILGAMILSRGFYRQVLVAHWDIVSFWNRNWRWIGADPIRESPIYGDRIYERPQKLHATGFKGILRKLYILIGFSPAAWFASLLVYERLFVSSPLLIYPTNLLVWLLLICLFAFLTFFVNPLKCLGAGYLYMYNTALVTSLLIALTYTYTTMPYIFKPLSLFFIFLNVTGIIVYYWLFVKNRRWRIDFDFEKMIEKLSNLPQGVVMCFPMSWTEPVAYKTNHSVMYGAHGYGFRLIEPIFPRLMMPIKKVIKKYNVKYLLTKENELPENFVADLPKHSVIREKEYILYCFNDNTVFSDHI